MCSALKTKSKSIFFKSNQGFTLIELAMVLIIFGLLLGGLLTGLTAQMEIRSRSATEQSLETIKEALIGYALTNGYLPCPDNAAIPTGIEAARDANGICAAFEGTLPWQTLGVARTDSWENYFRYKVTNAYANSGIGTGVKMNLNTVGGLTVNSDVGVLTTTAAAAILSHGGNGFGAKNTIQLSPDNDMPAPTGADELENVDGDIVLVSHPPTPKGTANEFDDMVVWIAPNILFNRMVAAGKLP